MTLSPQFTLRFAEGDEDVADFVQAIETYQAVHPDLSLARVVLGCFSFIAFQVTAAGDDTPAIMTELHRTLDNLIAEMRAERRRHHT